MRSRGTLRFVAAEAWRKQTLAFHAAEIAGHITISTRSLDSAARRVSGRAAALEMTGLWRRSVMHRRNNSLRSQQQHRHANAVLHAAGGGAEEKVSQKAMPMCAHRHQVAPFLFDPFDDLTRWIAVGHLRLC